MTSTSARTLYKLNARHCTIRFGNEYRSYIQTLKTTAEYRTTLLSSSAIQALRNLIACAGLSVQVDGVTRLIIARNGSEHKAKSVQVWLQGITQRIRKKDPSFPDVTPPILRHTFCTNLFRLGVNPKTIQKIMGLTNISTTLDVYTHMENEMLREQIGGQHFICRNET